MNKKIRFLLLFIILILLFIPFSKADAATYSTYRVSLKNFTSATSGTYKISSTRSHSFASSYGFNFHEVRDGNNVYIGYCLHAGKIVDWNANVSKVTNFNSLQSGKGNALSEDRQKLLKNILASGYQRTSTKSVLNGDVLNGISGSYGWSTCKSKSVCKKILATQILVWEVMEEARSNYNENPNNLTNNTYSYVKTDSELLKYYKGILADAKALTETSKPSSLDGKHTYTMHWNGSKYVSDSIDIGSFILDTSKKLPSGVSVSSKNNGKIVISSTSAVKASTINFKLVKGSTSSNAATFRWYSFGKNGYQDVVMGDYKVTVTASLKVKTESGKFKIIKKDENKKELKGSEFQIKKCYKSGCKEQKLIATVNLKNSASSNTITIDKSGTYIFKETKTPDGYQSIGSFSAKISIDDNGKVTISGVNNNNVTVTDNKTTLAIINIHNTSKRIKLKKIDGYSNEAIKGATFQIYNSSKKIVKFKKYTTNGSSYYKYDTTGNITNLVDSSLSTYTVAALPEGTYYVQETNVPYPYSLTGSASDRKIEFKISNDGSLSVYNYTKEKYEASSSATITVKNYKTTFKIIKKGEHNTNLSGVEFELYNSDRKTLTKVTKSEKYAGVYNYSSTATKADTLVTNSNGAIRINYLPAGTYYLKETKAYPGYTIDESMMWRKVEVKVTRGTVRVVISTVDTDEVESITIDGTASQAGIYEWPNTKGEFCFYKMDENGNYINGGKFKIQSYDEKTGKYIDTALTYNSSEKTYSFDSTGKSDIYTFSPIFDGQTCFSGVETKGKYRIVEIEAPEGYQLSSVTDTSAEFIVNSEGYVTGNTSIINKKITTGEGSESQAELIINIQTGQTIVRYGLIIASIVVAIIGLLFLNKKMSKK